MKYCKYFLFVPAHLVSYYEVSYYFNVLFRFIDDSMNLFMDHNQKLVTLTLKREVTYKDISDLLIILFNY